MGDVINYREMATIVRDRVQDMVKKGMTLDQVKAAKPTRDYDPLYNTTTARSGPADMFVEAVYRTPEKVTRTIKVIAVGGPAGLVSVVCVSCRGRDVTVSTPSNAGRGRGAARRPRRRRRRRSSTSPATGCRSSAEDWRFRMVTPPKGDYPDVPLNAGGQEDRRRVGPGEGRSVRRSLQGLRRAEHHARARPLPHHLGRRSHAEDRDGRGHADPARLRFGAPAVAPRRRPPGHVDRRGGSAAALRVGHNNLLPGYLQSNGAPYSAKATMMEYFDVIKEPNGEIWLIETRSSPIRRTRPERQPEHAPPEAGRRGRMGSAALYSKVNLVIWSFGHLVISNRPINDEMTR